MTDGLTVICLTLAVNYLTRKIPAFQAVILGTVITSVSWLILAFWPTISGAVLSLFVLALGEIISNHVTTNTFPGSRPRDSRARTWGFISAHRNWLADRRVVRRDVNPSFRRSLASA